MACYSDFATRVIGGYCAANGRAFGSLVPRDTHKTVPREGRTQTRAYYHVPVDEKPPPPPADVSADVRPHAPALLSALGPELEWTPSLDPTRLKHP